MMDIREGDIVKLNETSTVKEEYWNTKARIINIRKEHQGDVFRKFYAKSLRDEVQGDLSRNDFEFLERPCDSCGSELIHHDKKETWLCPFCDIQ